MSRIRLDKAAQDPGLWPREVRAGRRRRSWRARWTARIAAAAAAAVSGSMLLAAAPASAATDADPPLLAFNAASTNHLWEAPSGSGGPNPVGQQDTGAVMSPGTSPSMIELYNPSGASAGLYLTVYQGTNHDLCVYGPGGKTSTGLAMMPGTSPALPGGQSIYLVGPNFADVAYQSNTGHLMVALLDLSVSPPVLDGSPIDLGVQMDPKSSPAIARIQSLRSDVIAYHNEDGDLDLILDADGSTMNTDYGMTPGTSPSIIPTNGDENGYSGYEVAFSASGTNHLWVYGSLGTEDTQLTLDPGTSPGIGLITQNTYDVAINGIDNQLDVTGNSGLPGGPIGVQMMPGTSPVIFGNHPSGAANGYTVGYQSSTQHLAYYDEGSGAKVTTQLGMDAASSPAIAENGGIGTVIIN